MANLTIIFDPHFPFMYFRQSGFISQGDEPVLDDIYSCILLLFSLSGMVTNALNIRAFLLQTTKGDGVTVSMLALSLSDFFFCATSCLTALTLFFLKVETVYGFRYFVDPWITSAYAVNVGYVFYSMTSLTTTFLAVARCMCVAKPLQFSNTFTRSRSIAIHVCFAIVCLGGYLPVLSQMGARRAFNAITNQTLFSLWFSDDREKVKDIVFLIFDNFLTFASQFILVVCVLIMRHCLRQAGKFRHSTKATSLPSAEDTQGNGASEERYKLSGKELQVIQQVVLISAIYLICALPKIFSALYSLIEPEFDAGKKLNKFYFITVLVRKAFELVNSSSTFYIYCKYNSRFKELYSIGKSKNNNN